jgi:hypothetical protein
LITPQNKTALTLIAYAIGLTGVLAVAQQTQDPKATAATVVAQRDTVQAKSTTSPKPTAKATHTAKPAVSRSYKRTGLGYSSYAGVHQLNGVQLADILWRAGFKGQAHRTAWAIVNRESSRRPGAYNGNLGTGDNSYGLFQINMLGSLGPSRRAAYGISSNAALFDPLTNAKAAFKLSRGGRDFGAWGIGPNAYRSGAGEYTISKFYSSYPGDLQP